jgi:hypothetical protein
MTKIELRFFKMRKSYCLFIYKKYAKALFGFIY